MNIALFLQPKATVAYLYSDYTVRQAIEKMKHHGYSAIPVINREGQYVGTLSEGDLLWTIVNGEGGEARVIDVQDLEEMNIADINMPVDRNPPIGISANINELLERALNQNFIPVIDDFGSFIGIITRRTVIEYFYKNMNREN